MPLLARLFLVFSVTLSLPAVALAAPSPARNPSFWVTDGDVTAVAADSSRVYLGGEFNTVGPLTGSGVPLDAASGLRETGFPMVNGNVAAAVPDGSGGWYVGGSFDRVGGQPRLSLAHVLADHTVDPAFVPPDPDGDVLAMGLKDGSLYIGGTFQHIGATARSRLAKLDAATGALDATWDPNPTGGNGDPRIAALVTSAAGIYVGGNFDHIGNPPQARSRVALLGATGDGDPDGTFVADITTVNEGVKALLLANSRLYIGGLFTKVNGVNRVNVAAVSPSTGGDAGLDADANSSVNALAFGGGKLYIGGFFSTITHAATPTSRANLAAVDGSSGLVDAGFDPAPDDSVLALQASGSSVYMGGSFRNVGTAQRNHLAKVAASDGALDPSFDPTPSGDEVDTLAFDGSGSKIFAGGFFNSINGAVRNHLAALDLSTGAAVPGWNPNLDQPAYALLLLGGKLYVGGDFTDVNGSARDRIAAFGPATGALDPAFHPSFDNRVQALAGDGSRVYAGGSFHNLDSVTANGVAAVNAAGGSPVWRGDANGTVSAVALAGSRLFFGGSFDHVGLTARGNLAAVDAAGGGLDTSFNVAADSNVTGLTADGPRLYVLGAFTHLGGLERHKAGAIDAPTGAVDSWNPAADSTLYAAAPSLSGVYLGGTMDLLGGSPANGLAAVSASTGALLPWSPDLDENSQPLALAIAGPHLLAGGDIESPDFLRMYFAVFDFHAPASTSPPAIASGGGALGCTTGTWANDPVTFGYEWLRDGTAVGGAGGASYPLSAADGGHTLACRVTATNEAGSGSATSAALAIKPSGPVLDTKAPRVKLSRVVLKRRSLRITLACPKDEQLCSGTVTVSATVASSAKRVRLGSARFSIKGGRKRVVKVKLSRKGVKIAKRKRLRIVVKARDAAGNRSTLAKRVRAKRR